MDNQRKITSSVFGVEERVFADTVESIVVGGHYLFHLLSAGFGNMSQIGVIGWGSQGPAQAQNLRDSLKGTNINVKVGLRAGSDSMSLARAAGFTEETNTLGELLDVVAESDLVIVLISDGAQVDLYEKIFEKLKPGATIGFSHGFLIGYLDGIGSALPRYDINVIGVCPKGMGPSVRRLYEQGAGINCSIAVEQDYTGNATDIALAWSIAIGAPFSFVTTLRDEYQSDLFGERAILLGGLHGIVEALYQYRIDCGLDERTAFERSVENITGTISACISKHGLLRAYDKMKGRGEYSEQYFVRAYSHAYNASRPLLEELYAEIGSGNEIRSVVMATERLAQYPMRPIGTTRMWTVVAPEVRAGRSDQSLSIDSTAAGVYIGVMMAQIDVLAEHEHCWTEICNESIIEAVDSLNPYMHKAGVAHLVDNCSTTARLGTRKWGPRFKAIMEQEVVPRINEQTPPEGDLLIDFYNHPVHSALTQCLEMRPPIDISL